MHVVPPARSHVAHLQGENLLSLGLMAQISNGVNFYSGDYFQTSRSTDYMFDINAKERKDRNHWGDNLLDYLIATAEIQSLKNTLNTTAKQWLKEQKMGDSHQCQGEKILEDGFLKGYCYHISKEWHGRNQLINDWKLSTAKILVITYASPEAINKVTMRISFYSPQNPELWTVIMTILQMRKLKACNLCKTYLMSVYGVPCTTAPHQEKGKRKSFPS